MAGQQEIEGGARLRPETSTGHYSLELFGIASFFVLAILLGVEIYQGIAASGYAWLLPLLAIAAYLAADLISGFVHFLADNFGSSETPIIGRGFIDAFREHHVDPKGITTHDFVDTNGNNSLVSIPFMLLVWLFVPVAATVAGALFGAFFLMLCLGVFLTNQFHKWAHMEEPPAVASWLQERGVILSGQHHDVHHASPYDTYYCITVGVWNPLLDRTMFFERTERLIRRIIPGTDPRLRVERDGSLNER
ncbi:kua-ubiquitin conjugating enzyme hybrid localization domain protein [Rubrobacter marinus]|uniref:Kua-ubiquitin conjugating enzyme hybrid localization domain protein n=1 Tax=Rubrobacter marinus TaxID=2653852 RepID=A0A6G8PZ52_9ACTN|nr:fatty acid desaturase CarF family protein [Rubrobacter marinus]QIN79450.1 kua-ubiquitin conjugating enzyme hybrid localization domain protein [Rubrobacter marinus]